MSLKSERSIKIEHRVVYMFQKLDIQRISGKKQSELVCSSLAVPIHYLIVYLGSRQVKTFEANLTMTEVPA